MEEINGHEDTEDTIESTTIYQFSIRVCCAMVGKGIKILLKILRSVDLFTSGLFY